MRISDWSSDVCSSDLRPYASPDSLKPRFGFAGRRVLLTFGLIAQDKGIDHMIRALPAIVKEHPDVLYVVLGATHPNVIRHDGEKLRASLQGLAQDLGVQNQDRKRTRLNSSN